MAKPELKPQAPEATVSTEPHPVVEVRRFNLPDVEKLGLWLVGRLSQRWPNLNERNIVSLLRGAMESNSFFFVRTDECVALAQISNEPLTARPFAEEIFALMHDINDRKQGFEMLEIYRAMKTWARSQGCERLDVEKFTDASTELIKSAIGRVSTREVSFVKV